MSEEALQIAEKRREAKGKGEKERYIHLNTDCQRIILTYYKIRYKIRKLSKINNEKK